MTILHLVEPPPTPEWAPFAGVRPVAELRAGAWRIRERWERIFGGPAARIVSAPLAGFIELDTPPVLPPEPVRGPAVLAAAWFAPAGPFVPAAGVRRLTAHGATVARIVPVGETAEGLEGPGPAAEIPGMLLDAAFRLLDATEALLAQDCAAIRDTGPAGPPADCLVLGRVADLVLRGAKIEPGVVFDVRTGPVVVEAGAEVRSGTRLEGPCWIGPHARVVGGFVRASVIGPRAVVRGEIAASVFNGYANKAHEGFVGHSVVGHWVNLGAGTTTSNLKNTYGPVRLDVDGTRMETGRQFLGSLIGDHAKTAIGTLLATGTVVGAGANLFGPGPVPRYVPPFAWGSTGTERMSEDAFLRVAHRVMPRRDVELTPERTASLVATYRRMTPR